jgi:hypothetical protein
MKHRTGLVLLGLVLLGCNAILGNEGEYVDTTKTNPPPAGVAGRSGVDLTSAGEVGKSKNYKMVFTLGQSSPMQETAKSTNNKLQGGLVCSDGR